MHLIKFQDSNPVLLSQWIQNLLLQPLGYGNSVKHNDDANETLQDDLNHHAEKQAAFDRPMNNWVHTRGALCNGILTVLSINIISVKHDAEPNEAL